MIEKNSDLEEVRNISLFFKITITLSFIIVTLYFFIYRDNEIKFESPDVYFKGAVKCPENGFCINGRLYCWTGYEQIGTKCLRSRKLQEKEIKLAKSIGKFIYRSVDPNTCMAKHFYKEELKKVFVKRSKYFENAMKFLNETIFNGNETHHVNIDAEGRYYSEEPILSIKCRFYSFLDKNKVGISLIFVFIGLASILVVILAYNNYANERARKYSNGIISAMAQNRRFGPTFYDSSKFKPAETNSMNRYWSRIERNIEHNPNICTIQTTHGKKWKLIKD